MGYTLTTWNALYHLFSAPADAFRAPYAGQMAGLFDGSHQDAAVMAALPSSLDKLLTPEYLGLLRHPQGRLLRAFQANDTCAGWTPDVPVKLFAASGDTTVTQVNALQCAQAIRARGGRVQVIGVGDVGHEVSDFLALPQIVCCSASSARAVANPSSGTTRVGFYVVGGKRGAGPAWPGSCARPGSPAGSAWTATSA